MLISDDTKALIAAILTHSYHSLNSIDEEAIDSEECVEDYMMIYDDLCFAIDAKVDNENNFLFEDEDEEELDDTAIKLPSNTCKDCNQCCCGEDDER